MTTATMGKEIAEVRGGLPAMSFSREQIDLIKSTVAKGTTDDELALFLYTCKKTGLDPLAKQIHCVKRSGKNGAQATFQTSVDGYRLIADRTGKYAGNDDPIFEEGKDHPIKATVAVYKIIEGNRIAFTATARWSEYFPGDAQGFMWKKMPYLMLGKCAESLALRKAFPAELSGVYTNEEMEQEMRDVTPAKTYAAPIEKTEETKQAPIIVVAEQPESGLGPVSDEPINEDAPPCYTIIVKDVTEKTGTTNGKTWTRYGIQDQEGVYFGTFDKEIHDLAQKCKTEGRKLTIMVDVDTKGRKNITEARPA